MSLKSPYQLIIRAITRANMKSKSPKKRLIVNVTINTTIVRLVASLRVGQFTLRSSPIVSLKYRWIAFWLLRPVLFRLSALAKVASLHHRIYFQKLDPQTRFATLRLVQCFTDKTPPFETASSVSGRPGRTRTHNRSFWRRVLFQIELLACVGQSVKHF